jgi:hypothetical protein
MNGAPSTRLDELLAARTQASRARGAEYAHA